MPELDTTVSEADLAANQAQLMFDKLPPQLKRMVRVLGERAAFVVVQKRGGTRYTWPKSRHSPQYAELVEWVGQQAADAAVAHLGTEAWDMPKLDSVLRQLRHARVVELKRVQGLNYAEVALRTGYTVRQVIKICQAAGLPPADHGQAERDAERDAFLAAQGDLFTGLDEPGADAAA